MEAVTVISNIGLNPYWDFFMKEMFTDVKTKHIPFEDVQNRVEDIRGTDLVVVFLNIEMLYPGMPNDSVTKDDFVGAMYTDCVTRCRRLYLFLKKQTTAKILWFGFEDYSYPLGEFYGNIVLFEGSVDKINGYLFDMLRQERFIDFKRMMAMLGIEKALDKKAKYRWLSPYSKDMIKMMVKEVEKQERIRLRITPKCLVLDCDNVLWGGILSENGIESIQVADSGLGKSFQDFQRYLLNLHYHGVILVICSKNDESDVLRVFREHSGMLLHEEHIAYFQCDWNNKPHNIILAAQKLNIGLDSMVFVDDSIFELESVRNMLPQVRTVLYDRDTVYSELSCFNLGQDVNVQTVKERMDTYKTDALREKLQEEATTYEEYLASLKIVVDIHRIVENELARVSELTQRTNKCTNGVRYTVDDLKIRLKSNNSELYTVCLSDRFANLGVVGALEITNGKISLFSLSCRAFGRKIEEKMLQFAINEGASTAVFKMTKQNVCLQELFINNGITLS